MDARTTTKARLDLHTLEAREVPTVTGGEVLNLPIGPAVGGSNPAQVGTPLVQQPRGRYAVGTGEGNAVQVNVYDSATGAMIGTLTPFERSFTGGAQVATGDVTGDGVEDVVVAAGVGGGPVVKVFDGKTLKEIRSFTAYDPSSRGGTSVAVADVTGDGRADVITGAGGGIAPEVKVFDGKTLCPTGEMVATVLPTPVRTIRAYDGTFTGGMSVAAGDVDGDGRADIVTGAGAGGAPVVKVFDGKTGVTKQAFQANYANFTGGVNVAAADLDGDGKAEVIVGAGAGGGSEVQVFKNERVVTAFRAFEVDDRRGVRVAAKDVNGDGKAELLVASGPGGAPRVKVLATDVPVTGRTIRQFPAVMPSYKGGLFLG